VNREVRIGSLLSERSFAQFTGLSMGGQLELAFRFRPASDYPRGVAGQIIHLVSIMVNNDQEELLRVDMEEGGTQLAIRLNGDDTGVIRAKLDQQHLSGGWHQLSVIRDAQTMRAYLDDVVEEERPAPIEDIGLLVGSYNFLLKLFKLLVIFLIQFLLNSDL
jgi:hypothetical protein